MLIPRPDASEYPPRFQSYVDRIPDGDLLVLLERQIEETAALLRGRPADLAHYRYAPEKWSVLDVVQHLCDTERVFAYRALRFARNDATPLASFDDVAYAAASGADARALAAVVDEYVAVRGATLALIGGLTAEQLARQGSASGTTISVRALAYVIAGHERHHVVLLRDRYGLTSRA